MYDLISQLRERKRGWEGWRERKEELERNGKEDGRLGWMERRTVAGMGGWMTEEKWILG